MEKNSKELSGKAILLGLILSVLLGAANLYLGIKVGMTVSASIPAAVVAMMVFRRLNGSILEANQVQTAASASESLAAGIVFTVPAMVMVGAWQQYNYWQIALIGFCGGVLGVVMMIPMRKIFIVDRHGQLAFPEAVACEKILRAGMQKENDQQAKYVLIGVLIGVLQKFLGNVLGLFVPILEVAKYIGGSCFYIGAEVSIAVVSIGIIVRWQICLLIMLGAILGWWCYLPWVVVDLSQAPLAFAWDIWSEKIRFIGVGMMILAGLVSLYEVRSGLRMAMQVLWQKKAANFDEQQADLPKVVLFALLSAVMFVLGYYYFGLLHDWILVIIAMFFILLLSFLFTGVSSYIVGLVGSSNNPVSGMVISTVLITGFFILFLRVDGMEGMMVTLGVAAVVSSALVSAGDLSHDLKTGYLVGASPRKQQVMQIIGIATAALVVAPIMQLLHENTPGGIGSKELPAPQAQLLASLVANVFTDGKLDRDLVLLGVGIGLFILIIDSYLGKKKSAFRLHLMPIAVGIYLPFGLALTMLAGGVLGYLIELKSKDAGENDFRAVLLSSGLIAGESLAGVFVAVLAALQFSSAQLALPTWWQELLTCAWFALVFFYIYSTTQRNFQA